MVRYLKLLFLNEFINSLKLRDINSKLINKGLDLCNQTREKTQSLFTLNHSNLKFPTFSSGERERERDLQEAASWEIWIVELLERERERGCV